LLQFTLVKGVTSFFSEVKIELSKVTWPSREEVIKLTLIVFLVSVVLGAYVGGLDFLFTKTLSLVLK
jgi:preprotein translocase subunit SecE